MVGRRAEAEPPASRALQRIRDAYAVLNQAERDPALYVRTFQSTGLHHWLADDFRSEDHSSQRLGVMDRDEWIGYMTAPVELGLGAGSSSILGVVGTRGEHSVAVRVRYEYDDGSYNSVIQVVRFNDEDRMDRQVLFEPDDVDGAIAMLDAWHAEIGD